jgi:nicotinate dehydrogenase subunit A
MRVARPACLLNGRAVTVETWDADEPLLFVLRNDLALCGPKFGCGLG